MSSAIIAKETAAHTSLTDEAARLMTICNACRYCEGYCPVFPAMTAHRTFDPATLDYLANLCHQCTACYHACQYKPPHELEVNLPPVFTALRSDSYSRFTWPRAAAPLFKHNGLFSAVTVTITVAVLCAAMYISAPPGKLVQSYTEPGAFYAVMPHAIMAGIAGIITLFGLLSLSISSARFARYCGLDRAAICSPKLWLRTLGAVATLRHLDGGHGEGCNTADARYSNRRRYYHQFTMWGFMLCFMATVTATVYEILLGQLSPFPYLSLPVLFGTVGGVGLVIGPVGLLWLKRSNHAQALPGDTTGLDAALLVQLMLISLTGLTLLALRGSAAMPWLLTIHLGLVYGFFITLPFGKFVHGIYRTLALLRYTADQAQRK
jgi:citrate/tricarballylate utilization protein